MSDARQLQQSRYSYEGAIESIGAFARGTRGMSSAQARVVRRAFVLTVAALVVIVATASLVSRFA